MILFIKRVIDWIVEKYLYRKIMRRLALEGITDAEFETLKSALATLEQGAKMIQETEQAIKENTI